MSERKKIWYNILLFLLPIVLVIAVIFIAPANERFMYYFPKYNCEGQSGWFYDRLNNKTQGADIAFLGTSRTIDAIDDKLLDSSFKSEGLDMDVLNFGYCRFGRNMNYLLAKRMVENWDVKYVVLEVTTKENWDGHMDFGYLAGNKELFMPVMIFNDNYIEDIHKALSARFDAIRSSWFGVNQLPDYNHKLYGHRIDTSIVDAAYLDQQKADRQKMVRTTGFARWFYYQYSFGYIDKTIKMLEDKGCKVIFLYLPAYGSWERPQEYEFYKKRGIVLIPPKAIYDNKSYWKDGSHMNQYGAAEMASWLTEELATIIQPPH